MAVQNKLSCVSSQRHILHTKKCWFPETKHNWHSWTPVTDTKPPEYKTVTEDEPLSYLIWISELLECFEQRKGKEAASKLRESKRRDGLFSTTHRHSHGFNSCTETKIHMSSNTALSTDQWGRRNKIYTGHCYSSSIKQTTRWAVPCFPSLLVQVRSSQRMWGWVALLYYGQFEIQGINIVLSQPSN